MKVEDKSVQYKYNNLWSLFYFLRRHPGSPADFDQLVDSEPHTLKFVVETKQKRITNKSDEKSQAKIFIRVTPMAPDEKKMKTLLMPPFFLDMAPRLNLRSMISKSG